jgi:hypothetical protein
MKENLNITKRKQEDDFDLNNKMTKYMAMS